MPGSAWGLGLTLELWGTWGQTRMNGSWGFASGRVAWSGGRFAGRMKRPEAGFDTAYTSLSDHSFVTSMVCVYVRLRAQGARRTPSPSCGCLGLVLGDR